MDNGDRWVSWNGGKCPVGHNVWVDVVLRDGSQMASKAEDLEWQHKAPDILSSKREIVTFRTCEFPPAETNIDRDQIAKLGAHKPASGPDTLSVRDHFAMAALTGMLASSTDAPAPNQIWAIDAYRFADAMMKERSK